MQKFQNSAVVASLDDKSARAALIGENPLFAAVFDFIDANGGLDGLKKMSGKVEIDGSNVFVKIGESGLKRREDARLEAHDDYSDLQLVLDGTEKIGVRARCECKNIVEDRRPAGGDILFFGEDYCDFLELSSGKYAVLDPDCAHAPCIGTGDGRSTVLKAVFKIKIA